MEENNKKIKRSIEKWEKRKSLYKSSLKRAANTCKRNIYELYNYQIFPKNHWRRIKTKNMMEKVNIDRHKQIMLTERRNLNLEE